MTNRPLGTFRTATTNKEGYFQILALPIGNYKVTAEHTGFRAVISAEQKLFINQALRIDIKMEVGAENLSLTWPTEVLATEKEPQQWAETVRRFVTAAAKPLKNQSELELQFANSSYIVGIPGGADQIRSYQIPFAVKSSSSCLKSWTRKSWGETGGSNQTSARRFSQLNAGSALAYSS